MDDKNKEHRINTKIPINIKLKAIQCAKENINQTAAITYKVSSKTFRRWRINEDKFKQVVYPNKRITLHNGTINRLNIKLENEIYDWIIFNKSLGNAIITWALAIEFIKRGPEKKLKRKSMYQYIYRFMKRYNLVQRVGTHIGQLLSYDSEDKILKEIINIRKRYNIPIQNIVNMDETALMYNIPFRKTIHKI